MNHEKHDKFTLAELEMKMMESYAKDHQSVNLLMISSRVTNMKRVSGGDSKSKLKGLCIEMIRDYLNDDEEYLGRDVGTHKQIKHFPEELKNEKCQYVQLDFHTLNYTIFGSYQSKTDLNSKLAGTSHVVNIEDFIKCVNFPSVEMSLMISDCSKISFQIYSSPKKRRIIALQSSMSLSNLSRKSQADTISKIFLERSLTNIKVRS